jgi:hypothetical protein
VYCIVAGLKLIKEGRAVPFDNLEVLVKVYVGAQGDEYEIELKAIFRFPFAIV